MAVDEDLRKVHGLLEALLSEQVDLGRCLDRHLQSVERGSEENGHHLSSEDEKIQSILHSLRGVESEGSKLKLDLQILNQAQRLEPSVDHSAPTDRAHDELERLRGDVLRMAHTQQETETHLAELGEVLSTCLAGLSHQRSAAPEDSGRGQLSAEIDTLQKALQEERSRNSELGQTLATLRQAAEEGQQTKLAQEKALADGADEAKRAATARLKLQAELEEAESALKKERKLATKSKKRYDEESKKNIATFKELRKELKEQFSQVATLEDQVEELKQELVNEKARLRSAQEQAIEAQDQKRELQEMLRVVREEVSALKSSAAQASIRESGMTARISELEGQLANGSQIQITSEATALQSDDGKWEASYRRQEEEMRRAVEQWERERGERIAQVDALTAQFAQVSEELAQLKTARTESEERVKLATERTTVAEQALATATAEWTKLLTVSEEKPQEIESQAVHREREELRGNLDRLQAENARLSAQLKQMEQEVQLHKAEAETLRQLPLLKPSPALAAHTGIQTRRNLEPEMVAAAGEAIYGGRQPTAVTAAVSATVAAKDYNTRKVRRHSEADKEQDITDLLQSDDVVHTRPRTMPAKASADIMHDESGPGLAAVNYNSEGTEAGLRTDPVEYLSEELALHLFARLPVSDLLTLTRVNRKYRRIASDASLWRPKCQRLWHFQEGEGSTFTDTDWKEVYVYRHTHYKQVSCVIVGDTNVGKKTLITAFEGMVTQRGWKRGNEKHSCTVCVESLFGVPTMFNLTVLRASPSDPYTDLTHRLTEHLKRTNVDVFLVCVPASGSIEATQYRFEALEQKILPALDALCPGTPRILVGTETDKKEEHYDHSHPTAVPLVFSQVTEKLHFRATIFTSAMSNRGLVDLFEKAQSLVPTPKLRLKVSHDQVVVMNQTIRSKERKPPRSIALNSRASAQYGYADPASSLPTPLQTSPSSPRRQATPARATPYAPSTPYTPYNSSTLFTPASSGATPYDGPALSPYLYNQTSVSQSTPLPAGSNERRSTLTSAASAGSATPGSTARSRRHLRSSISDTPRPQRDNKCVLQ